MSLNNVYDFDFPYRNAEEAIDPKKRPQSWTDGVTDYFLKRPFFVVNIICALVLVVVLVVIIIIGSIK